MTHKEPTAPANTSDQGPEEARLLANRPAAGARQATPDELSKTSFRGGDEATDFLGLGDSLDGNDGAEHASPQPFASGEQPMGFEPQPPMPAPGTTFDPQQAAQFHPQQEEEPSWLMDSSDEPPQDSVDDPSMVDGSEFATGDDGGFEDTDGLDASWCEEEPASPGRGKGIALMATAALVGMIGVVAFKQLRGGADEADEPRVASVSAPLTADQNPLPRMGSRLRTPGGGAQRDDGQRHLPDGEGTVPVPPVTAALAATARDAARDETDYEEHEPEPDVEYSGLEEETAAADVAPTVEDALAVAAQAAEELAEELPQDPVEALAVDLTDADEALEVAVDEPDASSVDPQPFVPTLGEESELWRAHAETVADAELGEVAPDETGDLAAASESSDEVDDWTPTNEEVIDERLAASEEFLAAVPIAEAPESDPVALVTPVAPEAAATAPEPTEVAAADTSDESVAATTTDGDGAATTDAPPRAPRVRVVPVEPRSWPSPPSAEELAILSSEAPFIPFESSSLAAQRGSLSDEPPIAPAPPLAGTPEPQVPDVAAQTPPIAPAAGANEPASTESRTAKLVPGVVSEPVDQPQEGVRVARRDDLKGFWDKETIPFEAMRAESKVLTPLVGRVRVTLGTKEIFEGRLYAMGENAVWIDTQYGRMGLDASRVDSVVRLASGDDAPELGSKGSEQLSGLERLRVRTPGGTFFGKVISKDENKTVLITDDGARLTLDTKDVEYIGNSPKIVIKRTEDKKP